MEENPELGYTLVHFPQTHKLQFKSQPTILFTRFQTCHSWGSKASAHGHSHVRFAVSDKIIQLYHHVLKQKYSLRNCIQQIKRGFPALFLYLKKRADSLL